MAKPIIPQHLYAFKHKETGEVYLMLFIGTGDRIENYDEITEAEYEKIMQAEENDIQQNT